MTFINESLTPDLLFHIFKRLDCIETTRIRRVCKQWFEIIDEHKSFWRTLHLPNNSLKKWDSSILKLFDRKSGSTLQDVEIGVGVGREHQELIIRTLKKSRQSLEHLFLKFRDPVGTVTQDLLESLSAMSSLRVMHWYDSLKVRLRRSSNKRDSREDGSNNASPLRVFWYGANRSILEKNSNRFENLVSLDTSAALSASQWREFLEGPSRNLNHLRLGFERGKDEDHSGVPMLELPNLEVVELDSTGDFPRWLLIPDSAKLIAHAGVSNLPSISELWLWDLTSPRDDIINQLPKLKTFCLLDLSYNVNEVLEIIKERRGNVEAGLQVDGVKMEMIKTMVLPFDLSKPDLSDRQKKTLRGCRELVEVVEGGAQSRFIEVEF